MTKDELKELAYEYELTRENISEILGASIHTVNSWFEGRRNISRIKARHLKEYVEGSKGTFIITSKEIKIQRQKLGLSQSELADCIGVTIRTVQNYEAGETIPKSKYSSLQRTLFKEVENSTFNKDENQDKSISSQLENIQDALNQIVLDINSIKIRLNKLEVANKS
ncbi:helix-turn-helix domain-containing protein [Sediminicola arcticus]|jgi:DNA-binding transcriptional regulator YiaG|uniref:Helix-turn-helix domain-containing protein n=1 Tax=Sediminicola arcticus TaxID=1574308 RepID=A0ABV2SSC6_9FLAO